ncbi:MAG: polyprenyl synthetase family protein [Lachnospiraceae bacterium]|nr:polyprenyl synthetase family protein [Lachnospiraceae bacterium]
MDLRAARAEEVLRKYLPQADPCAKTVAEAASYSLLAGGKRLRPVILDASCRMYGGRSELAEPFMAALEMIHTFSLVHDDLPSMDDDEYRRGRKTTHIVYGEGMALLAGDALLNLAVETALTAFDKAQTPEETAAVIRALKVLMRNAGMEGMIGGQCADLEAEAHPEETDAQKLLYIHRHKTACMIASAFQIGAILAGAPEQDIEDLGRVADDTGIAFQIIDDILDVTGDSKELGKLIGSDEKDGKVTYVTMHGLDGAEQEAGRLTEEALGLLDRLGGTADAEEQAFLTDLVRSLLTRRK